MQDVVKMCCEEAMCGVAFCELLWTQLHIIDHF